MPIWALIWVSLIGAKLFTMGVDASQHRDDPKDRIEWANEK